MRCRWGSNPTSPPTGRRRGCRRVVSPCVGVRLSSATWYADTVRRLWMCKRGSCTIAHALRLWWRRRGRGCRAGPSSIDVAESPPAGAKGAGALQALERMDLSGASYPGRWVRSIAIRVGWPQPIRPGPGARSGVTECTAPRWRDTPGRMVVGRGGRATVEQRGRLGHGRGGRWSRSGVARRA